MNAIAFQKTSKTKRSLLWKSERDRLAKNLKNKAIAFQKISKTKRFFEKFR
ncbi:hypothetical protein [Nostoc sphaeroides]|uniref:Uncharacterized protein n=1 Tax=Nostoc sphaeroides CCNUC1 TaxID=2653204 RepID=A0A5P8VW21_9NOSO|nr:hypothetical protein [Nostoc sphaeroides]QFS44580.1 hypothetical protein GXM_02055 [Nostoc sphaeroides CCNUC1]